MEREKGWNLLCKFFDNMGPIPASHAPERRAGEAPRPQGQARGVLLPAAVQPDRQQLSAHVHGARAGHDQGRRAALPRELEQGRQRHPLSLARVPSRAGHRVADRSRHPARAGLARDLRAAGHSDVFAMFQSEVEGRIIAWACSSRTCRPSITRTSTTSSSMLDWDANVNPSFAADNRCFPKPVKPFAETEPAGYREQWITLRHGLVLGQGADRPAEAHRDDQGRRGLRHHPDAGLRHASARSPSRPRR